MRQYQPQQVTPAWVRAQVDGYAKAIVSGKIPACKWTRLACQRHLDDLRRGDEFAYKFDSALAARAVRFIQLMPHTKGKWAARGMRLVLGQWQVFFVGSIFGWVRKDNGKRRFRKAALYVPRKNGKSQLAAAIGLYMLVADGEYGAEVYAGATTEKQAFEIFTPAKRMVSRSPKMQSRWGLQVHASNIHVPDDNAKFEPVIGKPGDGASPHCALIDEYHEHVTDDLLDTMETGMGAREQPLILITTTAGGNMAGPCYALRVEAHRMLDGTIEDDTLFFLEYGIDEPVKGPDGEWHGDAWDSVAAMEKSNPNLGVSVNPDFIQAQQKQAINNTRKQGSFKTKHLNMWVGAMNAYFNVEKWRKLTTDLTVDDLAGCPAIVSIDLASKCDIAAVEVLVQKDGKKIEFGRYFLPEDALEPRDDNGGKTGEVTNDMYLPWAADGHLIVTDGSVIDYSKIKEEILHLCRVLDVEEVVFDPFQATQLVSELMAEGITCVEMRNTVQNLSEPMKELAADILSGKILHIYNPVMDWMMGNVVAREDAKENVFPRKNRREDKIDGPVALIFAQARCIMPDDTGDLVGALIHPLSLSI